MAERVTRESDTARWESLYAQWIQEHRPTFLVAGNANYRVLRLTGNRVVFEPINQESLYESTSL